MFTTVYVCFQIDVHDEVRNKFHVLFNFMFTQMITAVLQNVHVVLPLVSHRFQYGWNQRWSVRNIWFSELASNRKKTTRGKSNDHALFILKQGRNNNSIDIIISYGIRNHSAWCSQKLLESINVRHDHSIPSRSSSKILRSIGPSKQCNFCITSLWSLSCFWLYVAA